MNRKQTLRLAISIIFLAALFSPLIHARAGGVCGGTYIVESGDTFEKIAARCGTSVSAIKAANPNVSTLSAGQSIFVPGPNYGTQPAAATATPGANLGTYVVQPGDTFFAIAGRFNIPVYDLWLANLQIPDVNLIYPGQAIYIPASYYAPVTKTPVPAAAATSGPLSYGTVPFGTEKAKVYLLNKANGDVYVSLQGTTKDGYSVIYEYPVEGGLTVKIPSGKYFYVAWVGGVKFTGSFNLNAENDRAITFYKNKVVVE